MTHLLDAAFVLVWAAALAAGVTVASVATLLSWLPPAKSNGRK